MADRLDGYINAVLGHGAGRFDPFSRYTVGTNSWLIDYREADNLFTSNGLAQRVITIPADEAVRKGFKIESGEEVSCETRKGIESVLEDLGYMEKMATALSWDRLFGGGAVLMLVDDGRPLDEPLDENNMRCIERLDVYDPESISFTDSMLYTDLTNPQYGKPERYSIIGLWGSSFVVHETRLLLFHGGRISNWKRRMRNGWGGTVFEAMLQEIKHYSVGRDYAFMALGRLSQGILKLANMTELLMNDVGEEEVKKRLQLIDMARHMMNTIAIDTTDEYDLKNMSISGIREVLEQFQYAICAATGIPATKLFGRSPSGENSTGESDLENYYNMVEAYQQNTLRPNLVRLIGIISRCSDYDLALPENWNIEFKDLWSESEKEKAETKKLEAEAKRIRAEAICSLVNAQVLDTAEARETLDDDKDYMMDRSLDRLLQSPVE